MILSKISIIIREPIKNYYFGLTLKSLYHQFIDTNAFAIIESQLWDINSDIRSFYLTGEWRKRISPLFRYSLAFRGWTAESVDQATNPAYNTAEGLSAILRLNYRITSTMNTKINLAYINTDNSNINQYKARLGGWMDPEFESYVWDRTALDSKDILPQTKFGLNGPSLRIAPNYYTSFKHGFGINWEFLDFLGPCSIFFDAIDFLGAPVSVMTDEVEIVYEGERYKEKEFNQLYVLGVTLDMQLIKLHFPVMVNWDTDLELGGQTWQDHIRAEFNMDFSSFSFR